jgi:hypothetical protein
MRRRGSEISDEVVVAASVAAKELERIAIELDN